VKRKTGAVILVLALLGILAAAVAGCGGGSSSVPSGAVATVGDTSITKAQVDELVTQAKAQLKAQGSSYPKEGTAEYDQYTGQIVDYLVQLQVIAQSAAKDSVSVTDTEVKDQIAKMQDAYGGKAFQAMLKKAGMTQELLDWTIRSQLLTQKLQAKVVKDVKVTDTQLQAYWDAHKSALSKKKKTATFAKAKATIQTTLLQAAQDTTWAEWLKQRAKEIGVVYAAGYDPATLMASPSPSTSPAGG